MTSQIPHLSTNSSARQGGLRRKQAYYDLTTASSIDEISLDCDHKYLASEHDDGDYNEKYVAATPSAFESFSFDLPDTTKRREEDVHSTTPSSVNEHNTQHRGFDHPLHDDFIRLKTTERSSGALVRSAIVICVPMIMLSAALLFIVFNYRVRSAEDILNSGDAHFQSDQSYLLVDFSSTKLVFLASFLSTAAPLTAGSIMSITATLVYRILKKPSEASHFPYLPTPYQISLIIGVLAASYEQLFSSFKYLASSKRTAKASPALLYAISIFVLSIIVSVAVTVTDANLHIATQTVPILIYSSPNIERQELGKGINSYCLGVNRLTDNYGFPCSYPASKMVSRNPDWSAGQAEIQLLAHNSSVDSTIYIANTTSVNSGRLAFLMAEQIPDATNFEASTIGVSAECSLIPPNSCNISTWGPSQLYTSFNCSPQFWGVLGYPPVQATYDDSQVKVSPNLSFLAINRNVNLIYNYFADDFLEKVYNPSDLDAMGEQPDSAQPWPDSALVNPVNLVFAWRTSGSSFIGAYDNQMVNSNLVSSYPDKSYVDYFVKCAISSYNVNYIWNNGSLQGLDAQKHQNGSVLQIWTGMTNYMSSVGPTDLDWQQYNLQSVVAGNSTEAYETRIEEFVAQDALAAIGAYTTGRQTSRQQTQTTRLVAKVPKAALGALVACSLLYPIFGIVLLVKAWKASRENGPVAPLFSYWGLTSAAFLDQPTELCPGDDKAERSKPRDQEEALRLFIRNDNGHDRFALWRRSRTGYITEQNRFLT